MVKKVTGFGAQGVELFYAISGFIIPYALYHAKYKIAHYGKYIAKRLLRLFPPYLATIAAILAVGYFLSRFVWHTEFDIHFKQLLVNVLFIADLFPEYGWINPIFATLEVELQFYILIGLLFPLFLKGRYWTIGISLVLLLACIFTREFDTVFVNCPYFLIGLIAFQIREFGFKIEHLFVLAAIFICLFQYFQIEDLAAAALAFSLLLWLPKNIRFLQFTGKISYSYYLVHGLFGGWFLYFTKDTNLWINYSWLMIIFALAISWLGAWVMYLLIEKPCIKLSSKITYHGVKTKT